MSVTVFTVTHVPFTPPQDPVYVPLHAGRALHEDLGYIGDDTGDNISEKNPYYGELTGLYWIWKNRSDCADYLGLCHYRRYFLNDNGVPMTAAEYEKILSQYDVMIAKPQTGEYDYRTVYARSHDIRNLKLTEDTIRTLCPEYLDDFEQIVSSHSCYIGNLFVAPRALFRAYCEWLFDILFTMENSIDTSGMDEYHKRLFGFLSEQLLMVWIRHNRLSCYEAPFGISQEKAETIALKESLRHAFKAQDIDGAYRLLCDTLDRRPDVLLDASDFDRELHTIEHILNVCRTERESGLPTLLAYTDDMNVLIRHFRLLVQITDHIGHAVADAAETQYLSDSHVSPKALIYIMQNMTSLSGHSLPDPPAALNRLALLYTEQGDPLHALFFLEEALQICDTDVVTLQNAASLFARLGQEDAAAEYAALAHQAAHTDAADTKAVCSPVAKKKLRIVVFCHSDIPILHYISGQYVKALEHLGHTALCFDIQQFEESAARLIRWLEEGVDAALLLNNIGFEMRLKNGVSLWDQYRVPVVNQLVDHPMFYADTLDHAPACGIVACADRYHVDYCKRFYPAVHRVIFLPTAGECRKPYAALKPFAQRPIDVLFIGSYKYDRQRAAAYEDIDRALIEELCSHPDRSLTRAIDSFHTVNQISTTTSQLKKFIEAKRFLELQAAALFRRRILEALVNGGITVTVCGSGWEELELFHHPNFIHRGVVTPEDGISLMEDAKIVLNQLTWFKAGASERIFEAMLQGAVCLTDDSAYLREQFTDGENIAFYSLERLERLPDLARGLLSDADRSESMRRNAYDRAVTNHTWESRAAEFLSCLS